MNGILAYEEFLAPAEAELLWGFAMAREPLFVASEVTNSADGGHRDHDFRRSRVLYDLPGVHELLVPPAASIGRNWFEGVWAGRANYGNDGAPAS